MSLIFNWDGVINATEELREKGTPIKTLISEEIAKTIADAPENLNTLKEIADWIEEHADSATAMNTAIKANSDAIENLKNSGNGKTISKIEFKSSTKGETAGIEGATDTYEITYTDNTTDTFVVYNGLTGQQGPKGDKGDSGIYYGTCADDKTTIDKTVTIDGLETIEEGVCISVLFPNGHRVTSNTELTLNVNNTGAKPMVTANLVAVGGYGGNAYDAIKENETLIFMYDGTNWKCLSQMSPVLGYSNGTGGSLNIWSGNISRQTYSFDDYGRYTASYTYSYTPQLTYSNATKANLENKGLGLKYKKGSQVSDNDWYFVGAGNNTGEYASTYGYMDYTGFRCGDADSGSVAHMKGKEISVSNGYYYNGEMTLTGKDLTFIKYMGSTTGFVFDTNVINPYSDNTTDLGSASLRYKQLYAGTTTISTSDERKKDNILSMQDKYKKLLLEVTPITFTFKNEKDGENHDRVHCGFSAQEVKSLMDKNDISSEEFGAWCQTYIYDQKEVEHTITDTEGKEVTYKTNENDLDKGPIDDILALRYEEFIPILTGVVQDLNKKNQELEKRIIELEKLVNN